MRIKHCTGNTGSGQWMVEWVKPGSGQTFPPGCHGVTGCRSWETCWNLRCKVWPAIGTFEGGGWAVLFFVVKWHILVYSDALFKEFHTYQSANYWGTCPMMTPARVYAYNNNTVEHLHSANKWELKQYLVGNHGLSSVGTQMRRFYYMLQLPRLLLDFCRQIDASLGNTLFTRQRWRLFQLSTCMFGGT